MSNSINKVFLMGRLGHDPKVASTPTGRTVTELNIATSETYGKGEDKKEKTEWHKVICWDKLGEVAGNYLKKGSQVHVEGKITYRDYMDRDNKKRYVTEIVANNLIFIGGKSQAHTDAQPGPADPYAGQSANYQPSADDDDAVPF